jgi:hypothetical protein
MDINNILQVSGQIFIGISTIVTGATVLAKLTPTRKDDNILAKIQKALKWIADIGFLPDVQSKK